MKVKFLVGIIYKGKDYFQGNVYDVDEEFYTLLKAKNIILEVEEKEEEEKPKKKK